jgi:hypothetical protein
MLDPGIKVRISRTTGFITRARSTDPESKSDAVLESLDLEVPEDSVFAIPESAPEGAEDGSAEMRRTMQSGVWEQARRNIWSLTKWIDDGQVTWDEDSPEKLTRVFRSLQAELSGDWREDYSKRVRESIDSVVEDLTARVQALDPGDDAGLAQARLDRDGGLSSMERNFKKELDSYSETVRPPSSMPRGARMSDVFLECERNAVRAECEEQVFEPLLALYREKTDEALAR